MSVVAKKETALARLSCAAFVIDAFVVVCLSLLIYSFVDVAFLKTLFGLLRESVLADFNNTFPDCQTVTISQRIPFGKLKQFAIKLGSQTGG